MVLFDFLSLIDLGKTEAATYIRSGLLIDLYQSLDVANIEGILAEFVTRAISLI